MSCKARQYSDEMVCAGCRLRWDVNDPAPPSCAQKPVKIEPKDPENYSPIYITKKENHVMLYGDSLGEPDPNKMLVLSNDQLQQLTKEISDGPGTKRT